MTDSDRPPDRPSRDGAATPTVSEIHDAYRRLAIDDFGWDTRIGLTLALFHTFAAPRVAGLLSHTGHVTSDADKRTVDTSLFIYELIHGGMEGERGRDVIRRMNRMHGRWDILNEDYLFVLSVFIVTPIRWTDSCGWRRTTHGEKQAAVDFYRRMGSLMGITGLPHDYDGFTQYLDEYHEVHLKSSTASFELAAATMRPIAVRLPRVMRPIARVLLSASLRRDVSDCLGLRSLSDRQRRVIAAGLRATSWFTRPGTLAARPWFSPGGAVPGTYPRGYSLDTIGPQTPRG